MGNIYLYKNDHYSCRSCLRWKIIINKKLKKLISHDDSSYILINIIFQRESDIFFSFSFSVKCNSVR
jgi:hypothetical protein